MAEMMDVMKKLKKDVEDDLRKFGQAYVRYAADTASFMMKTEARKILIETFYEDFDPLWYKRTYNILNRSYRAYADKVVGDFNGENGGYSCDAILSVSSDDMYYYSTGKYPYNDKQYVLEQVWGKGSHGGYSGYKYSGSIINRVEKAFDANSGEIGKTIRKMSHDFAFSQARYLHYKILRFDLIKS